MSGGKRAAGIHGDAVAKIARKIIRGRMAAGAALPTEPEIGAELGVSRTVVREAMKTLAAKGMVVTGPRKGTRVRSIADWNLFDPDVVAFRVAAGVDERFLDDLLELRLTIEPMAARLAAARGTPMFPHTLCPTARDFPSPPTPWPIWPTRVPWRLPQRSPAPCWRPRCRPIRW